MYILLAICLSLFGLLTIYSLGTLAVALAFRAGKRATRLWPASRRAQLLFLLRIVPGLAAILCVGMLFLPAYLVNEPRQTTEIVTFKLGLLAAASLFGIARALWCAYSNCAATSRLVENWLKDATPVAVGNERVPAFRFAHRFPVIAIVGALRPKLFIADQVFGALNAEEIAAAIAHENGHLHAADNLKRGLLHACRSMLTVIPLGRSLDQAWIKAAESAADDYAARGGASTALNLASALVKIARLAPSGCKPVFPAEASLIVEDPGSVAARVLHLTQIAADPGRSQDLEGPVSSLTLGAGLSGVLLAVTLAVFTSDLLAQVHWAIEHIVSVLQ